MMSTHITRSYRLPDDFFAEGELIALRQPLHSHFRSIHKLQMAVILGTLHGISFTVPQSEDCPEVYLLGRTRQLVHMQSKDSLLVQPIDSHLPYPFASWALTGIEDRTKLSAVTNSLKEFVEALGFFSFPQETRAIMIAELSNCPRPARQIHIHIPGADKAAFKAAHLALLDACHGESLDGLFDQSIIERVQCLGMSFEHDDLNQK